MSLCSVTECGKRVRAKGLCNAHYERQRRLGDARPDQPLRRFARPVDHEDGSRTCTWCGSRKSISEFGTSRGLPRAHCLQCACADRRARYDAEPDKHRSRVIQWIKANPDRSHAIKAARRARERGAEGAVSRADLRERDGDMCSYCATPLDFNPENYNEPDHVTVDHVIPLIRGGQNTLDNTALACRQCNLSKGAKTLDEWMGRQ